VNPIAAPKILLTGNPGSGKTTTIRATVELLRGRIDATGFTTEEIREEGRRIGFRGVTLDGHDFLLAHARNSGAARVGPYGVELAGLESIGLASLVPSSPVQLVVVDEIGKMECLSEAFKTRVAALLDDDTPFLGTVAAVGVGFVKRVRNNPRVKLYTVSKGESQRMAAEIARALLRALGREEGVRS
jgi:nucleoside-triphosphatase